MKHNTTVTLALVLLFLAAQLIGLVIISKYTEKSLPFGIERPEFETNFSYVSLIISILIATGIALIIINLGAMKVWKAWFIFASLYLLTIAMTAFFSELIAFIIALGLVLYRVLRLSLVSQNISELFIYSGIAAIFSPVLSIFGAFVLLFLISIYDMIAVWKTKHMIKLAKFQTKSNMFAGLLIPYNKGKKAAILGGGDIGFPMIFAGTVLVKYSIYHALITVLITAFALLLLLLFSKKNKFYPAMPFISAGCFAGFFLSLLIL